MERHAQLTAREIHGPYVQLLTNLQGEEGQEWLKALKRFLRKENPWEQGFVLTVCGSTEIMLTEERQPTQFFQDRNGLRVLPGFSHLIANAKVLAAGTKISLDYFEFTTESGVTDIDIESGLAAKGNHFFEIDAVAAIIAELISAQEGGKEGVLLINGVNIFYTGSLVVDVHWLVGHGKWRVSSWQRDGSRWRQGRRVFILSN